MVFKAFTTFESGKPRWICSSTGEEMRTLATRTQEPTLRNAFHRFSHHVAKAAGSPLAFLLALMVIVVWGATGRIFHYSDTWQLIINTGTTIVTFLMVFLIQ